MARCSLYFLIVSLFLGHGALLAQKTSDQKVISGTVLLNESNAPDNKALISALKINWKLKLDSINAADKTLVFNTIGGATVMIAFLNYPAAPDEIGAAARLSWLWKTANEETRLHKSQVVISVIGPANKALDLYKIFTQTAAAVLELTKAPGIYLNSQYLLLSNGYFTASAHNMLENQTIPLYCWVYFGRPGGGNAFTYGLSEFGLPEMEIVNATFSEADAHALLFEMAMSVVKYNTRVQDGQSLSSEEGTKAVVHLKQGTFLEDQKVLQLEF